MNTMVLLIKKFLLHKSQEQFFFTCPRVCSEIHDNIITYNYIYNYTIVIQFCGKNYFASDELDDIITHTGCWMLFDLKKSFFRYHSSNTK